MKKALSVLVAVLMVCGALVVVPATRANAQATAGGCTTQGALALGLAELLKLNVTTAAAARDALVALGVEPNGGWKLDDCLTPEAEAQIRAAYARASSEGGHDLAGGAIDAALEALRGVDRQLKDVSPSKP